MKSEAKARKEFAERKFRDAVQTVLRMKEGRFLLGEFFADAGLDASPRRDNDRDTYHAIGWQDAGSWWINAIRAYCPEREAEIRNERIAYMKEAAPPASQGDEDASDE